MNKPPQRIVDAILILACLLPLGGCRDTPPSSPPPAADDEPTVVEEISVTGFDVDGEPVIKKWSDGSLWIHFQAMPPFFSEDDGTEARFETFENDVQKALGVPVVREDREVFVIPDPEPDTVQKAKDWLEGFHK
jgi:hypothetical protein